MQSIPVQEELYLLNKRFSEIVSDQSELGESYDLIESSVVGFGLQQHSGVSCSMVVAHWTAGLGIDTAPGAWLIAECMLFAQVLPSPIQPYSAAL